MQYLKQYKDGTEPIGVSESEIRADLEGYYKDIDLAIQALDSLGEISTSWAIYYRLEPEPQHKKEITE